MDDFVLKEEWDRELKKVLAQFGDHTEEQNKKFIEVMYEYMPKIIWQSQNLYAHNKDLKHIKKYLKKVNSYLSVLNNIAIRTSGYEALIQQADNTANPNPLRSFLPSFTSLRDLSQTVKFFAELEKVTKGKIRSIPGRDNREKVYICQGIADFYFTTFSDRPSASDSKGNEHLTPYEIICEVISRLIGIDLPLYSRQAAIKEFFP